MVYARPEPSSQPTLPPTEWHLNFGKDRFAELAPAPILEPPLPGRTLSPVVTSRSLNIRHQHRPDATGKRRARVGPHYREEYARGDLNPQPSAPEADALSS